MYIENVTVQYGTMSTRMDLRMNLTMHTLAPLANLYGNVSAVNTVLFSQETSAQHQITDEHLHVRPTPSCYYIY